MQRRVLLLEHWPCPPPPCCLPACTPERPDEQRQQRVQQRRRLWRPGVEPPLLEGPEEQAQGKLHEQVLVQGGSVLGRGSLRLCAIWGGGGGILGVESLRGGSLGSGNRRGRALLPLPDGATAHRSRRRTGVPEGRRARLWTPGARARARRSRGPRELPGLTSVCPRGGSGGRRGASPRPLLRLQPGAGDGKEESADLGRRGGWVGQHAALRCRQQLSQLGAQAGGAGLAQAAAHRRQQLACTDGGSSAPW
jgi:hypothetical protein